MSTVLAINDVITQAATAIQNDPATLAFLESEFGTAAWGAFYIGIDYANPPRDPEAPYCVVSPAAASYDVGFGDGSEIREPVIDVDWGVFNNQKTTTPGPNGPLVTCNGLAQVDALGQLILGTIYNTFGPHLIRKANYMITPIHPLYDAGMTVTISFEQGMGELVSLP
jgi:hypothetical protein